MHYKKKLNPDTQQKIKHVQSIEKQIKRHKQKIKRIQHYMILNKEIDCMKNFANNIEKKYKI